MQYHQYKAKPPLPPITADNYEAWRHDPVTEHLFQWLEFYFFDQVADHRVFNTMDHAAITAIRHDSLARMVDAVLEWTPFDYMDDGEKENNAE